MWVVQKANVPGKDNKVFLIVRWISQHCRVEFIDKFNTRTLRLPEPPPQKMPPPLAGCRCRLLLQGYHRGPGPIKGHPFSLKLGAGDKHALIAFLKTL